jgi:hypothetical protein
MKAKLAATGILLAVLVLVEGCKIGEHAGEKAARIVATDVIPRLTDESEKWRGLSEEAINKLPEEFRDEFDKAFQRAISAAGTEYKCGVAYSLDRLRQELEALSAKWKGEGSGPSLKPHFCSTAPTDTIEVDVHGTPDEESLTFVGYNFIDDYKEPPERLIKIELEYTNGQSKDLTKCCLDNPSHYNMTVKFDSVDFTPDTERLVLKSLSGWPLGNSVGIVHLKPTMTQYLVTVNTECDWNSGTDENVRITIFGKLGAIRDWNLDNPDYDDRKRCAADKYESDSTLDLGEIQSVDVVFRNVGGGDPDGWGLMSLEIVNKNTGQKWFFPSGHWFDLGEVRRTLTPK